MTLVTEYYPSKARSNRFGNHCIDCKKSIESGEQIMRANLGYNSFGKTHYSIVCLLCWGKNLEKRIDEAKKYLVDLKKSISELEVK